MENISDFQSRPAELTSKKLIKLILQMQQSICEHVMYKVPHCFQRQSEPCSSHLDQHFSELTCSFCMSWQEMHSVIKVLTVVVPTRVCSGPCGGQVRSELLCTPFNRECRWDQKWKWDSLLLMCYWMLSRQNAFTLNTPSILFLLLCAIYT